MTLLQTSAKGATLLILFQFASRGFTFLLNQILLQYLSPEILGLSAQLELYSITVLFFARESIRVACQRQATSIQTVINFGFLPFVLGIPLAYGLALLYKRTDNRTQVPQVPYFIESLSVYGISAVIELLSEPYFIASQQLLLFKVRATSETIATVARCLATCATALLGAQLRLPTGVLPFAVGQLVYSCLLLLCFAFQISVVTAPEPFSLLPRRIPQKPSQYFMQLFSKRLSSISLSLSVQNAVKYVLTQSDGMLIAALAPLKEQGSYTLASNYGGLVARMLFQPIEETSQTLFAQLCNNNHTDTDIVTDTITVVDSSSENIKLSQAKSFLQQMLRFYCILGLVACSIGPTVGPILLRFVAGRRWAETDASNVLASYCYYIPLLALNGVSEGFVTATASKNYLNTQSVMMGVWFAVFATSTYVLMAVMKLGASGLVYANCINMGLRIIFNLYSIRKYFASNQSNQTFEVFAMFPNKLSIAHSVAVWTILNSITFSSSFTGGLDMSNLLLVASTVSAYGVILLYTERNFILPWVNPFLRRYSNIV